MSNLAIKLDFTFRVIVLVFAMTLGVMFIFLGARNALAANLNETATVTGNVLTVGDIFSGLSYETASKVLGPAPLPGKDMVLNARTLMHIAMAMDLSWKPSHSGEQITIRREATLVTTDDIKNAVANDLKQKGIDGRFNVSFFSTAQPEMILPYGELAAVEISNLSFDPQHDRFTATLKAPSNDKALAKLTVSGKIERLIPVPILKKTMSSGDVINAYDIEWVDVKSNDLQNDVVLNADDIVGMTPRRMIISGKPVRGNELERPQLVSRGDTITITYNDGFMLLTAQGKAMQSGAKGDIIRVANTSSNRTVEAFIEGEFTVTVMP